MRWTSALVVPSADPHPANVGDEQRAVVDHSLLSVQWIETAQGSEPRLTPPAWYAARLAQQDEPQKTQARTREFADSRHRATEGRPPAWYQPPPSGSQYPARDLPNVNAAFGATRRLRHVDRENLPRPPRSEIRTLIDPLGLARTDPGLKRAVQRHLGL